MATTRPFAYNTGSPIPGTEQIGSLAIGTPTAGFGPTGLTWWNGPDEDLGYVICRPVPSNTHPTPVRNSWNSINVGVGNTLSNKNRTVTNSGVLSSVISNRLISGKTMFSIKVNQSGGFASIGFGKQSMNINGYVGSNDGNSTGFGTDGNFFYYGGVQASGLPIWGDKDDIVDVCIDLISDISITMFIRVNGGNWNGNQFADPTTGFGGIGITILSGVSDLYPAVSLSGGSVTILDNKTEIGGYYSLKVGSFTSILGNTVLEDDLIYYAKCQGFNIIQLYDLYTIFDNRTLSNQLDSFIGKVYSNGLYPVAIMGSGTSGFDLVDSWEKSPGRVNKFWGVNKENEFWWHGTFPESESFTNWIASMNYVRTTYPHWHRSAYIANPTNSWGSLEAIQMISAQIDVLEVTNYNDGAPDATWPAFKDYQLQYLANAANSANVIQKFVPLWSSEQSFSGIYFSSNGLPNSAKSYNSAYDGVSITNKNSINKIGFSIFMYSDLSSYVPDCPTLNIIPTSYTFLGRTLASISFIRSSNNEQSFIDLVNTRFNKTYVLGEGDSAKDWLNANGYWTSWGITTPLVTSGLTLRLEANNLSSYPTTGSIWYDIAGTQENITLVNSPSFTPGTPAYFSFDGVSQYGSGSGEVLSPTSYTKSVWFYLNSYADNNLLSSDSGGHYMYFSGGNRMYSGHFNWPGFPTNFPSNATFNLNTWYNATLTFNTTDGMKLYINGILDSSYTAIKTAYDGNGSTNIACFGVGGNLLNGRISKVYCYNRSLTDQEVIDNFNSNAAEFGYDLI